MNIEERNLNKIPENQIQIKTITKLGLSQECKLSLTSSKKSCNSPHQKNERRKKCDYLNSCTRTF